MARSPALAPLHASAWNPGSFSMFGPACTYLCKTVVSVPLTDALISWIRRGSELVPPCSTQTFCSQHCRRSLYPGAQHLSDLAAQKQRQLRVRLHCPVLLQGLTHQPRSSQAKLRVTLKHVVALPRRQGFYNRPSLPYCFTNANARSIDWEVIFAQIPLWSCDKQRHPSHHSLHNPTRPKVSLSLHLDVRLTGWNYKKTKHLRCALVMSNEPVDERHHVSTLND